MHFEGTPFSLQGPSCGVCKPSFVGFPEQDKDGCSPCHDFCTGNSNICVNESIFLDGNFGDDEVQNFVLLHTLKAFLFAWDLI